MTITADNESTVRKFMEAWGQSFDASIAGFHSYCTPELIWGNSGLPNCNGVEEAIGLMTQFRSSMGLERIVATILRLAASDTVVFSERVDYLLDAEGKELGKVTVAGVMEMKEGRIHRWRDYFDPAVLTANMGGIS